MLSTLPVIDQSISISKKAIYSDLLNQIDNLRSKKTDYRISSQRKPLIESKFKVKNRPINEINTITSYGAIVRLPPISEFSKFSAFPRSEREVDNIRLRHLKCVRKILIRNLRLNGTGIWDQLFKYRIINKTQLTRLKTSLDGDKDKSRILVSILEKHGVMGYENFIQILKKPNGGWQGYLAELLDISVGTEVHVEIIKKSFWLIKFIGDFLFLKNSSLTSITNLGNLFRNLNLSDEQIKKVASTNCQIREQIIHCFILACKNTEIRVRREYPEEFFIDLIANFKRGNYQLYQEILDLIRQKVADKYRN